MATNDFPDGCVLPENFIPNPPAPEAMVPPLTHQDLSWIADNTTRKGGQQPKTPINPAGEITGLPFSIHL